MAIGSQSAEAIKLAVGSATPLAEELETEVRGRDLTSGLPREIQLDVERGPRARSTAPLADILAAVHATLEETPPELAADITKEGILLAGGGALLRGLVDRVEAETGMPVRRRRRAARRASRWAPGSRSRSSTGWAAAAASPAGRSGPRRR